MNPQEIEIDLSKADEIVCDNCGNKTFIQVVEIKRLSPIVSPTGQEAMIPVQMYACAKCLHVNEKLQVKVK